MILPAVLIRRGKYSVADPIFVDERRPVLVARKLRRGAEAGDLVLVQAREMKGTLRGGVKKVLGSSQDPRNVYDALFASVETSRSFPEKAEEEADRVSDKGYGERRDRRDLATVTIDGEDAKDFDDAISISRTENGYRLWVHIADVTHYVKPGSLLDKEALRRANSVYLPGMVAPMLPERLSNGVCSLRPGVERPTVTIEMEVDSNGKVKSRDLYRSLIRSDARLTYKGVDAFLQDEAEIEHPELVATAQELAQRLRTNAAVRGKLDLGGREPEYELDPEGVPLSAGIRRATPARNLIEELMVLANETVAGMMGDLDSGVFRVHEKPSLEDMETLKTRLSAIGVQAEPTPDNLGTISQTEKSDAVNYMILRSIPRAAYMPQDTGHFGLASEHYTHFTSPIRRYADVLVHRALLGDELPEDLEETTAYVSEREYRSMICERTADDYTLMWLLQDRIGETLEGTIVSTTTFGLFVEVEAGATGLVHVSKLPGWWELEENGVVLSNDSIGSSYRVGDKVLVELIDVSPLMRRAELRVVKRL